MYKMAFCFFILKMYSNYGIYHIEAPENFYTEMLELLDRISTCVIYDEG